MQSTLQKIVDYKKEELEFLKRKMPLQDVRMKARDQGPVRPFLEGFYSDEINIIAEIKKASPSAGVIRSDFQPVEIAKIYEANGARALSVLTDENFFKGSLDFLSSVREAVSLPCLRKDFTLDEYHLHEARGAGADAVLLIAAILDDAQLKDYIDLAESLMMIPLVEVHDEDDLDRALKLNPHLIGINNRNLNTFETTLETSLKLRPKIPEETTVISESGLRSHDDLVGLMQAGFHGFLIGEALMRSTDIGAKLKEFIGG